MVGLELAPADIKDIEKIISVHCGNYNSYCIDETGAVWSFGSNEHFQQGHSDDFPAKIALDTADSFASGSSHGFIRCTDGTIWGLGLNGSGQLGIGTNAPVERPEKLSDEFSARIGPNRAQKTK